jgi:hypothetical protein
MKNPALFYGAIVAAVLALVLAVYYIIPGIYHPLTTTPPYASHPTHAIAFFILAIICIIAALVTRPKSARR